MLSNHLKIAFRRLLKNKMYSIINISGLAIGIAAFLLILEFVSLEKSVDQFHTNSTNKYRMLCQSPDGNNWPQVEPGWLPMIKSKFPEVIDFCRFEQGVAQGIVLNQERNLSFREQNIGYVEGNFFSFFHFPLVSGKADDLKTPNTTFISKSFAKKYFGENTNVIGKSLKLFNQFGEKEYTIQGVFTDIGDESTLRYDMVMSLETLKNKANLNGNGWADLDNIDNQYMMAYLELDAKTEILAFEKKLSAFRREMQTEKDEIIFRVQPMTDIHLGKSELQHSGNRRYVYMLLGIAFLIVSIAWFNYINLNTANAIKRANEVGVRKVIGASRDNLLIQFLSESLVVNVLACVVAIGLMAILQPLFNDLIQKNLSIQSLFLNKIWAVGLSLIVAGSLMSGLYNALSLSHFKPIAILKGKLVKSSGGVLLRKSLVVTQFSISVALIISTILVFNQLQFMRTKNLGFAKEQLVVLSAPEIGLDSTYKNRKAGYFNDISQLSFVKKSCTSGTYPGRGFNFATAGFTGARSKPGTEAKSFSFAIIGDQYLPVYDIRLVAGRNFTNAETLVEWNDNDKIIVNEKAARELGYEQSNDILQDKIKWDERYLQVIGVVQDYHHEGLQQIIKPIIFYPSQNNDLTVQLTPDDLSGKLQSLEKIYKLHFPGNPFEYKFVDEQFYKQYESEAQFGKLFTTASILAILIACLGLFGLTVYTVESRTKEIGIRKVLGASVSSITTILSTDFIILVAIGILIASPIAYFFMNKWLADFAYRVNIEWWVFVLAGMIAVGIALITVSVQSVKAALANPIKSLRTE